MSYYSVNKNSSISEETFTPQKEEEKTIQDKEYVENMTEEIYKNNKTLSKENIRKTINTVTDGGKKRLSYNDLIKYIVPDKPVEPVKPVEPEKPAEPTKPEEKPTISKEIILGIGLLIFLLNFSRK